MPKPNPADTIGAGVGSRSAARADLSAPSAADLHITTPLGPFVIPAALLTDHDAEVRYCYTQLGARYDPKLAGDLTVRLELTEDGDVKDAVVTKRTWQGISAGEVEACVRALMRVWKYSPAEAASSNGVKEVNLHFAP